MRLLGRFLAWICESLLYLSRLEAFCLRGLEIIPLSLSTSNFFYPFLEGIGFRYVQHRRAITIFSRGKFISTLEAPDGHRWQHFWPHVEHQELGPEIELSPTFFPWEYEDVPTSLAL